MNNETSIVRNGLKKHKTGLASAALASVIFMAPNPLQAEEVDAQGTEQKSYQTNHELDDTEVSQDTYSNNHVNDLNEYRTDNGKEPLTHQDDLDEFAKSKIDSLGEEMPTIDEIREFRENGGNIHEFNGRTVTEQYEDFHGDAPQGPLGENVAYFKNIPGTDAADGLSEVTMDTWENSPVHDRNMKEDGYGSVGSAYYMDGDGTYYTVQIFETGEREVTEVAPENIPENEVVEEALATPEPEVEPEVETNTGADEVAPAEPEVEEPVAPEPETNTEPEVEEPVEPDTDNPVEEEVPVTPEADSPVEPEAKESETEPEPTPEPETDSETEESPEDVSVEEEPVIENTESEDAAADTETEESPEDAVAEEEADEVEESTPPVDEEPSDNKDEPVVENATVVTDAPETESPDSEKDAEADGSPVKSEPVEEEAPKSDTAERSNDTVSKDTPVSSDNSVDVEQDTTPVIETIDSKTDESVFEVVETVKTPAETVESDSEMIAEAPDTPVTPIESDDATSAVEGVNGSDGTEIAPQDTPVSDEIESSDEITPVVEESVETNTSVDEPAVNTAENAEDEQMLPNTGVANQTMPVVLGSIMAFFGGIALWFSRKRKSEN